MGSGLASKRKKADTTIIRVPLVFGANASTEKGISELAADKCPPSFDERIEESPFTKQGLSVYLQKDADRFLIMMHGAEIGVLSKRNSNRVGNCFDLAVHYSGKIVKVKDEYYARFVRETD